MQNLDDVKSIVTYDDNDIDDEDLSNQDRGQPKLGHAKIAYNADKTYKLKNIDKEK